MTTTSTESKPPPEPKQDLRDLVLAFLVAVLLMPFVGMLRALTYRLLWGWFLAPQYGEGPSLQAWFGLGILFTLIAFRRDSSGEELKNPVRRAFESAFLSLLMLGAMIISAVMARVVWGWR